MLVRKANPADPAWVSALVISWALKVFILGN